ncbi:MAG: hypothetical protein RI924_1316 [Bacteroidota bacterium]|jgi:hypothetical protein
MKTLQMLLVCLLLPWISLSQVKKEELPALLESKKFVFKANTAIPFADADLYEALRALGNPGGGTIALNSSIYDLQLKTDSIMAFLPYFGRSYGSIADREEMSIKFNSKKFSFKQLKRKKGGWSIQIVTQDLRNNYRLNLDIGSSGYATLSVRDNFRQPISYYGYIEKLD